MSPGQDERIAIACGADAGYVRPLAAMVQSVLTHHRTGSGIDVFIVAGGIAAADRKALEASWEGQGARAHWLDAPDAAFAGVPLWGRMSVTTYYKLAVPGLLPPGLGRVIWLDCDLLVLSDVARLWSADLAGRHLLAVQDRVVPYVSSPLGLRDWAALGLPARAPYFNAGVMLMDLARWRADRVAERAIEYLRARGRSVYFWDQEGLNAVLAGQWGELDERWNCNVSVPGGLSRCRALSGADDAAGEWPWVLHFTGSLKPWLYPSRQAHRRLYFEHLDRTPWAGWRPGASVAGFLVDRYESSGARRLVYPAEQLVMRLVRAVSRRAAPAREGR